ncbi:MAG: hypothetical protein GC138_01435 [Gammaproteobacteria bacterium]|nr:hypothetical protein [Gammaproteobacteria bacterium]
MLVLTRRQGEYVLVYPSNIDSTMTVAELFRDGPIEVHVGSINKNQVRLNIKAPGELTILRNELVNEPVKQTATA